ncbi:hypothetical protein A3A14_03095 [Candidatus Daviesbacteria bacterium RIFCSPLOWO2_01_FULL_43_38]|uniref:Phage holin family protein n=2 Tax=Candidatus Daviesiibacteriota TaxID=1752718 RepID=A0A1F5K0J7_9BACT|nr:MAG: hypothetical protein UV41_C0013G0009 [Candidatus Daviesbacteria bacterium GW2011_GWA2_42_7]OGE20051.1 MAG: hypothetical protein A2874_01045 [Candidatus Daviesbacteria bacterium RIFCSPHIGHO2_01_FULL_43_17]OGE34413.1 MAG: hypothetical protein A3E45_02970 [Candidatus Daviesbacteria bacterium RIFCSPHIGHO2_12_FULL_43_11]OGE63466.1 MAG: hypothetical protein A3A14_03095 [Candidatus Daviesbacteria bacterium RIFCSPLOWO2_01_FULL_43_38]OGE70813.1 MAG: hypothetical protein A3J21_00955 [Candidatus D
MKTLLRNILINIGALWVATSIMPSFVISGGLPGFLLGAVVFMAAGIFLTPLIKILLLPLNLLTLGVFAWFSNVLVLYFLTTVVPNFKLLPYHFEGLNYQGFIVPEINLPVFQVAIVVSFLIGFIIHFANWLVK